MSKHTSPAAIRALEAEDWRSAANAVTPQEAASILAEIAGRDAHCTPAEAAQFARSLIAVYPGRELNDADAYAAALTALFAAYPRDFVKRVCNPVTGLPSRLPFFPTIAEASQALKAEDERRKRITANARYVLEQAEKRRQEAEEARRFEQGRLPPEERARQVQALLRAAVGPSDDGAASAP